MTRRFPGRPRLALLAALLLAICPGLSDSAPPSSALPNAERRTPNAERPGGEKVVIGAVEQVTVGEAGLPFDARVDSGARLCSIHATAIRVKGEESAKLEESVGRELTFRVKTGRGEEVEICATLEKITRVRSAVGAEDRPAVYLTLEARGVRKKVLVSLRDREEMEYKLLLGRNWLEGDFLVDVSR